MGGLPVSRAKPERIYRSRACPCAPSATNRRSTRAHDLAARTQGTQAARQESRHTGAPDDLELEKGSPRGAAPRRAPKARGLHDRPHDDPEEAELGASEDRACAPHEPHG